MFRVRVIYWDWPVFSDGDDSVAELLWSHPVATWGGVIGSVHLRFRRVKGGVK